ncbi:MAG TPA: hypothetical protein VGO63_01415 [Candidatus Paceibacterota bacterium]|jgi:hypothetical protein|nr:hypothetical protein [Candidatus Paceibacterota bacterium]
MDAFLQMKIFFLISSLGFIVIFVLVVIALIYIIRAMHIFERIISKAEKDIDKIGESAKDIFEDIRASMVFRFLFKKLGKRRKD